ncbi:MAG: tetratricopeptide repeat protein [Nitrospinota bacterium]
MKRFLFLWVLLFFPVGCTFFGIVHQNGEREKIKETRVFENGSSKQKKTAKALKKGPSKPAPMSARDHFKAGLTHVKKGEGSKETLAMAVTEFSRAISMNPELFEARLNLGLTYLHLERFDEALKEFIDLKKKSQGSLQLKALYNIGLTYMKLRRFDNAIQIFTGLAQKDHYEAILNLGKIHLLKGSIDAAVGEFERAIDLAPARAEGHESLGVLNMNRGAGFRATAITNFKKVLELSPQSPTASFYLGVLYYQSGENDNAVKMFRKVTMLSAEAGAAYYNLGLIHYREGDNKNAVMFFTLAKSYDYPPAIVALTKIYLDGNRIDPALNTVNQFIALNPEYPEAFCSLGAILQKAGRNEEAMEAYKKALELAPENIMALNNLAVLHRKAGEFDKAIDLNYKILKIDPNFPFAHKNLGIIYDIFLNDYKVAKYHYGEYLRIGPYKGDNVGFWIQEMDKRGKS